MTTTTIRRNHPVREAFSGCSTGNTPGPYYETKGHALRAFDTVLADYGFHLDCTDNYAWSGDVCRHAVDVYDSYGKCVGSAILSCYRMESGRYEFVGYLA